MYDFEKPIKIESIAWGTIQIVYVPFVSYTDALTDKHISIPSHYEARNITPNHEFNNWHASGTNRPNALAELYKIMGERLAYDTCRNLEII